MQMKHNSQRQHFCLPFNLIFCSILVNQLSSLAYSLINFRQSSLIGSIVDFLPIITIFFLYLTTVIYLKKMQEFYFRISFIFALGFICRLTSPLYARLHIWLLYAKMSII